MHSQHGSLSYRAVVSSCGSLGVSDVVRYIGLFHICDASSQAARSRDMLSSLITAHSHYPPSSLSAVRFIDAIYPLCWLAFAARCVELYGSLPTTEVIAPYGSLVGNDVVPSLGSLILDEISAATVRSTLPRFSRTPARSRRMMSSGTAARSRGTRSSRFSSRSSIAILSPRMARSAPLRFSHQTARSRISPFSSVSTRSHRARLSRWVARSTSPMYRASRLAPRLRRSRSSRPARVVRRSPGLRLALTFRCALPRRPARVQ